MPEPLPPTLGCASCVSRDVLIAAQAEAIEELTAANARLVERVTALERDAGRNSGNSGMPPSTDDLPGRRKPAPRRAKGSGRQRGKQDGAPGGSLPWVAEPDEHVAHRPEGGCVCGADLAGAAEVGIQRSHQVHDLPEVRVIVRQHDIYRVRCGCGREHVATLPEQVSTAPSSYGPLCRHRHNGPYADLRIMPTGDLFGLLRSGYGAGEVGIIEVIDRPEERRESQIYPGPVMLLPLQVNGFTGDPQADGCPRGLLTCPGRAVIMPTSPDRAPPRPAPTTSMSA